MGEGLRVLDGGFGRVGKGENGFAPASGSCDGFADDGKRVDEPAGNGVDTDGRYGFVGEG